MQDPSTFAQIKPQFPEQEQLKCPRCDSNNTKFCYYNNYNLSQPRHFCKNCRRYWTKGGALRNIPVGGRIRKNTKRSSTPKQRSSNQASTAAASLSSSASSAVPAASAAQSVAALPKAEPSRLYGLPADDDRRMLDNGGSFSSLLASQGQFGNLLEGLNPNWSPASVQLGELGEHSKTNMIRSPPVELPATAHNSTGSLLTAESGVDSGSCWSGGGGGNGWPDLAIDTPVRAFSKSKFNSLHK